MAPLLPMHTLGHGFVPDADPRGRPALPRHGAAGLPPRHTGLVEARAYPQNECFAEAIRFARSEGIIPAPEPSHALRAVAEEVERAREEGVERTILFNLCGHGHFDMSAYDAYLSRARWSTTSCRRRSSTGAAEDLAGLPRL